MDDVEILIATLEEADSSVADGQVTTIDKTGRYLNANSPRNLSLPVRRE
jgi:hypothetical protein